MTPLSPQHTGASPLSSGRTLWGQAVASSALPWQQTAMTQTPGLGLAPPWGVSSSGHCPPPQTGTARSPGAWLPGRGASGFWAVTWLLPPSPSGLKSLVLLVPSPPPKDRPCPVVVPYRGFYFGHSILLPENSTPPPPPVALGRDVLLLFLFFSKAICWLVGWHQKATSDLAVCPRG